MHYQNTLHRAVDPSEITSYSTLVAPQSTRPLKFQLPQFVTSTPSKKPSARDNGPKITHIAFYNKGHSQSRNGSQSAREGLPMADLTARSTTGIMQMMEGGEDHVFSGTACAAITFLIGWPGYTHMSWTHKIDVVNAQGPITRARLAQIVAQSFSHFIEAQRNTPSGHPDFKIGTNGIRLEHLTLRAIRDAGDNSWIADVIVNMQK